MTPYLGIFTHLNTSVELRCVNMLCLVEKHGLGYRVKGSEFSLGFRVQG